MDPSVPTKDPAAVEAEVQSAALRLFPAADPEFVPRSFDWVIESFTGKHKDYQAIDAQYHDLEHTLQGTLCTVRLLRGRHLAGASPPLTQRMFELGVLAILLHDTGYLKTRDDTEGTGAKYTAIHVGRSAAFAAHLLGEKGFSADDIRAVQNMIHCTGVDAKPAAIPFQSEIERLVGLAVGTGDLLGQMAAADYVDKLPILYEEFAEASNYPVGRNAFVAMFASASDLLRKTPVFWEKFVRKRLIEDFDGLCRFLNDPYPDGPNYYITRIEANIDRVKRLVANGEAQPA
jgi:hypothetical protein